MIISVRPHYSADVKYVALKKKGIAGRPQVPSDPVPGSEISTLPKMNTSSLEAPTVLTLEIKCGLYFAHLIQHPTHSNNQHGLWAFPEY